MILAASVKARISQAYRRAAKSIPYRSVLAVAEYSLQQNRPRCKAQSLHQPQNPLLSLPSQILRKFFPPSLTPEKIQTRNPKALWSPLARP